MAKNATNFKGAVVVLSYDRSTLTERCLQSIFQLHEHSRQVSLNNVFLVHNGSTRSTVHRLQQLFPQIQHLILEKNVGYAGGANHGLKIALQNHPWAVFLSNDCQILNWPELPSTPKLCAAQVFRRKIGHIDSMGAKFSPLGGRLRHCRSEKEFLQRSPLWTPYVPGSAFAVHREVFLATGGFDESLFTYWEDVDLSQRTRRAGLELHLCKEWQVVHGVGKTCHGKSLYSIYYFQRNRHTVAMRYTPRWARPLNRLGFHFLRRRLKKRLLSRKRHEDAALLDKIF